MEIQKNKFKFTENLVPLNLNKVDGIALHHMAHPTADEYTVHKWHLGNKWFGIGYNYWIGFDGRIVEGRGLNIGAGVKDHNMHVLSIGFQGDYDRVNQKMPKEQFEAGVWIIDYLKTKIPSIKNVAGHNNWNSTSCPGKYFPLEDMIEAKPEAPEESKPIIIKINGEIINMDAQMKEGRVMVPVRYLAEALGKTVLWIADEKIVDIR